MKPASLILMAALLQLTTAHAENPSKPSKEHSIDNKELHEFIISNLKQGDPVIPEMPAVHPKRALFNPEAVIPPQCYTRTEARHNPCFVCHQDPIDERENRMGDEDLQRDYSFSDLGMTNHWRNLHENRSERVDAISDDEILDYIAEDNYSELAARLEEADFDGWIPDLENLHLGPGAFDEFGFAKDGSGWVAFNYKPFPSTFWPTNGSTDDIMIRLPLEYRTTSDDLESPDIYRANLAILEAKIKGLDEITCLPVNEAETRTDLDGDGMLGTATRITILNSWVGKAAGSFIDTHLYPQGTEFLHSVRYVGIDKDGTIGVSTRMKELRYMRKSRIYSKSVYARRYQEESFEKDAGNLPGYISLGQNGLDNGSGWALQGFIENVNGRLRTLTYEENFSCMGCHNSIGSTIDKTFGFPRKPDGAAGWGYINLKGMPDAPSKGASTGEIATYLSRVGGGSEFRNNDEMYRRWFRPDGQLDRIKLSKAKDVYDLIAPSRERALSLNKAYRCIVEDQDFIYGKDATVKPPKNVYELIDNEETPTLPDNKIYQYNILLDWPTES